MQRCTRIEWTSEGEQKGALYAEFRVCETEQTLRVVYSKEPPMKPVEDMEISCRVNCICPPGTARKCTERRSVPGSNAFVPSVAGLIIAAEVVKDITGVKGVKS